MKYENSEIAEISPEFFEKTNDGTLGYSYFNNKGRGETYKEDLSNFIIRFSKQVSSHVDGITTTFFEGQVVIHPNTTISFDNFPADLLASINELKKYMTNLCGTKVAFSGNEKKILEAIKIFNRDVKVQNAIEFGYNKGLTEFNTPDLLITKDGFFPNESSLLYNEIGNNNYLGFNTESEPDICDVSTNIIDSLLPWDQPEVSLLSFAFTMLPVIYPFVRDGVNGKPFMLLKGGSGSGKTTQALLLQQFYGDIKNLESWTSTTNAIQVKGNAFKDSIFVVDDLKEQNLNEYQKRNFQTLIQNYSDETGRNRANVNLALRDSRIIKAFLLMTGEDVVINESSAVARGIIVSVHSKEIDFSRVEEMKNSSKVFKVFTKHYIKFILNKHENNQFDFKNRLESHQKKLFTIAESSKLHSDNLPRLINNFSLLSLSWDFVSEFMKCYYLDLGTLDAFDDLFYRAVSKLLVENSERIQLEKPEIKFEETLWNMIETNQLLLVRYKDKSRNSYDLKKVIGYYEYSDNQLKVCIKLSEAHRQVNQYLRGFQESLGHSYEAVKTKLISQGKIRSTKEGHVSFGSGNLERGVYWIGEIPWERFIIDPKNNSVPFYY